MSFSKRRLLQSAVFFQALLGARFQLIEIPSSLGDADDGDVESLIANQVLQRRENLLVGEIARGSEKYKGIRHSVRHVYGLPARCSYFEFAMACLAAETTCSTVKPKCSITTFIGADMPKVCMPSTTPVRPA